MYRATGEAVAENVEAQQEAMASDKVRRKRLRECRPGNFSLCLPTVCLSSCR